MPRKNSLFESDLASGLQVRLEGLGGVSNLLALAGFAMGFVGVLRTSGEAEDD